MNNLMQPFFTSLASTSAADYLILLLNRARQRQHLKEQEIENIQLQLPGLFAQQADLYTGGLSGSIPADTAQRLLASIIYTLGLYLKSIPDESEQLRVLRSVPLSTLCSRGYALLESRCENAMQLSLKLQQNHLDLELDCYQDTIHTGLPAFFSLYSKEYAAHDTPAMIDYPLSMGLPDLRGIEYMEAYMHTLLLENEFCSRFPTEYLQRLLYGYHPGYKDLILNIFQVTVTQLIGCVLAGTDLHSLQLRPIDLEGLQTRLCGLLPGQLHELLRHAAEEICSTFAVTADLLINSIYMTAHDLQARLDNAVQQRIISSVLITLPDDMTRKAVIYTDGDRLSDEDFRLLTDEIRNCRHMADKIALFRRHIHSMRDLLDVLCASCFFGSEYAELYTSMNNTELALLQKNMPEDETDFDHTTESEKEWQQAFTCFLPSLDEKHRANIRQLAALLIIQ